MNIADWFYGVRLDKGLILADICELTGIAQSQISRIENKQSELTLFTAIKVAYVLDVSILEIVRGLDLQKDLLDLLLVQKDTQEVPMLATIQDVEDLIKWYSTRPMDAKNFLYEAFGEIRFRAGFEKTQIPSKSWDLVKAAIEPVGTGYNSMPYPAGISTDLIQETLLSQGVLSFLDLGIFIRRTRQHSNLSLLEVEKKTGISYSALRRIEVGDIERIKIDDIFVLDEVLGSYGEILAIAWRVGEFYTGVLRNNREIKALKAWTDRELALAETLIAISRWYQVYSPQYNWLKRLRMSLTS